MEEAEGLRVARARIAEEADNRTGILDLGGLGLTSLPAELFELQHLRELNLGAGTPSLGDLYFVPEEGRNRIDSQIDQVALLPLLHQVCVGASDLRSLEALAALEHLTWLDCSDTMVADPAPLRALARSGTSTARAPKSPTWRRSPGSPACRASPAL